MAAFPENSRLLPSPSETHKLSVSASELHQAFTVEKHQSNCQSTTSCPLPTMPEGPHMCEASRVRELRPLPPTPSRRALPSAWRRVRLIRQMWLMASMKRTSFSLAVLIWL